MLCGPGVETTYADENKEEISERGYKGYNCEVLDKLDLERKANQ